MLMPNFPMGYSGWGIKEEDVEEISKLLAKIEASEEDEEVQTCAYDVRFRLGFGQGHRHQQLIGQLDNFTVLKHVHDVTDVYYDGFEVIATVEFEMLSDKPLGKSEVYHLIGAFFDGSEIESAIDCCKLTLIDE